MSMNDPKPTPQMDQADEESLIEELKETIESEELAEEAKLGDGPSSGEDGSDEV